MMTALRRAVREPWLIEGLVLLTICGITCVQLAAAGRRALALALQCMALLGTFVSFRGPARRTAAHMRKCRDQNAYLVGCLLVPMLCCSMTKWGDAGAWEQRAWISLLFSSWFLLVAVVPLGNWRVAGWVLLSLIGVGAFQLEALLPSAAFPMLLWDFTTKWKRSFTFGEACVTASALSLPMMELGAALRDGRTGSSAVDGIIIVILGGLVAAALVLVPIARNTGEGREWVLYAAICALVGGMMYPAAYTVLRQEPFRWVASLVLTSGRRAALVGYWCLLLANALFVLPPHQLTSTVIIARKYYHILAVAIMLPASFVDSDFLRLACAVALGALFMVEIVSLSQSIPLGAKLHRFMTWLADKRDRGDIIVSHIYLLVGCTFPLWLSRDPCSPAGLSGLASLGIYDAVASAVGVSMGRAKILNTRKTVEGTSAGILAAVVFWILIRLVGCGGAFHGISELLSILFMVLVEVFTTQNDNLVLPISYCTVLVLFHR